MKLLKDINFNHQIKDKAGSKRRGAGMYAKMNMTLLDNITSVHSVIEMTVQEQMIEHLML